jgi:hypothetical protein
MDHITRALTTWLLPSKAAPMGLLIVDITDPYDSGREEPDGCVIDSMAFLIGEFLAMNTDLAVDTAVCVDLAGQRLVHPVGELSTYDELKPLIEMKSPKPVLVWGAAERNARHGLTLRARFPNENEDRVLRAELDADASPLIAWLVENGVCSQTPPPGWWRPVPRSLLPRYAKALDNLQLLILADRKNEALPRFGDDDFRSFFDHALALTEEEGAPEQVKIVALTTALYGQRAGSLDSDRGLRAIQMIRQTTDESSPIHLLAPHLLEVLGEAGEASARRQRERATAEPAYVEWLRQIAHPDDT